MGYFYVKYFPVVGLKVQFLFSTEIQQNCHVLRMELFEYASRYSFIVSRNFVGGETGETPFISYLNRRTWRWQCAVVVLSAAGRVTNELDGCSSPA
jgi:hypothetical protein